VIVQAHGLVSHPSISRNALENLGNAEIYADESYEDEQEAVGWNNELEERAERCKWNGDCKRDNAQGGEE